VPRRRTIALAVALFVVAAGVIAVGSLPGLGGFPAATLESSAPAESAAGAPAPVTTEAPPAPEPSAAALRPSSRLIPSSLDRAGIRDRLQAAVDRGRAELAAPGVVASVLFADGRQWTGTSGVADLSTNRPLGPDTPFAVASISKTFLAAEILALVREARLGLDDAVAGFLPDVSVGGLAIDRRITIRQLLDHTSGLRDYLISRQLDVAVRAEPSTAWTAEMALAYAGKAVAEPGVGYHYANTNYVLLGLIAERLAGRSLAAEYRARFFEPLALKSASYQGVEPPAELLPTAYRYASSALDATPIDVTDGTDIRPYTAITTAAGAAGSVAASARDLARWARALYAGFVLPEADIETMVGDAAHTETLEPGYPYGLGVQVFMIDGHLSYGHSGRLVGARSVVRWFAGERIAIAVVTNQSRFDPTSIVRDLLAIVAPETHRQGPTAG